MGKLFSEITPEIREWIEKQKMFFVSTAPLSSSGHVNCSPKGLDSFRVLSPTRVAYQDLTGSGVETIAHLRENRRITIMFCAFDGPPKIYRLYGKGEVVLPGDEKFHLIHQHFPHRIGIRSYIVADITRITDSCGYGVPHYDFQSDRNQMIKWADHKGEAGVVDYQNEKNLQSIDGLTGLKKNNTN